MTATTEDDINRVTGAEREENRMGDEHHETIEDIVSEMRRDCPIWHRDGTRFLDGDWVYTKGTVERLADRIEEAVRRVCSDCAWYHIYNDGLSEMGKERQLCATR